MTFSIISTSLVSINLGQIGSPSSPAETAKELTIPWLDLAENPLDSSLLSWHTKISDFFGREREMVELSEWANSGPQVNVKFLTGKGGAGKSRLAAEFAEKLREEGWSAGFVQLKRAEWFLLNEKGTLMVVDYPEENRAKVTDLLRGLAFADNNSRVRVLFLTRQTIGDWLEVIQDANAKDIVDIKPISLAPLDNESAHKLYISAIGTVAEKKGTLPPGLSEEALADWISTASENERPLFILAAALHSAMHPGDEIVKYSGKEVVRLITGREIERLRRIGIDRGLPNPNTFSRLLAMSAISGPISIEKVNELALIPELQLGLAQEANIGTLFKAVGLMDNDVILPPEPDILAAAFTIDVLALRPETAPEIIWAALSLDVNTGLERFARLSYDAEIDLQIHNNRMSVWLAQAVEGHPDRCKLLDPFFSQAKPLGWYEAGVAVWSTLRDNSKNDEKKAGYLNNLSADLSAIGETAGALEASKEAVSVYRRLSLANPARFEPDLALSLNNLSNRLSDIGETTDALEAVQEAVEILRPLARADSARYEPDLALSLNNLSIRLGNIGEIADALEAVQEAVELYRRLAEDSPARYEPNLALSLNNLSKYSNAIGETAGALEAIQEAVELYRHLVEDSPARYEPDLALSLTNLSNCLSAIGETAGTLEAIQEAVEIRRRLTEAHPARYESDLADSLHTLSNCLSAIGETAGALEAIQEAVEIRRRLAQATPDRYEPDLAGSLNNLSKYSIAIGETAGALKAIQEAVELYRRLAEDSPARYKPDLALSLNNLSNCLSAIGETVGALEAIQEAVVLYRRLAEDNPVRYKPDLARSLGTLGTALWNLKLNDKALDAFKAGVDLIRPFAVQYPKSPFSTLLSKLESALKRTEENIE